MKRLIALLISLLLVCTMTSAEMLLISEPDPLPEAMAQQLPASCIAAAFAPGEHTDGILFAVHDVSYDGQTLQINLQQTSIDPTLTIYEEDVYGVTRYDLVNIPLDVPVIGSYCEVYIVDQNNVLVEDARSNETFPQQSPNILAERFSFALGCTETPDTIRICVRYGVVEAVGEIDDAALKNLCFDISLNELAK